MRILHVIASVDPATGGPVEVLHRSSAAMAGSGHEFEVVCLDAPDAPFVGPAAFPVHALGPGNVRYRYCPALARWVRANRSRFDIAILHGLWNYSSFGAWRGLAGGDTPYVIFAHGMLDPWFRRKYPLKHVAKQIYWFLAEGRVLRDAAAVLFTNEEERELARNAFRGYRYKAEIAPIGTEDPPPATLEQDRAFRATIPALGERRFLLFLSRIHPKKGCDILIEAFATIARAHPGLDLVIAGPDQIGWQSELEAMAARLGMASRIHWPGMLAGDAKWGAFRAAEAFVLPSHSENFGIVVAEAMACGTPVVITDKVNIWREVHAGIAGFVSSTDPQEFAATIRRFLLLPLPEREQMGRNAREVFLHRFEVTTTGPRLAALLDDIVRANSSDRSRK